MGDVAELHYLISKIVSIHEYLPGVVFGNCDNIVV